MSIRFPTRSLRPFSIAGTALTVALLAGCGGGGDDKIFNNPDDPDPSNLSAAVTVTNATDSSFNGLYASSATNLADVAKINPVGGDPETCRYRFSGPTKAQGNLLMEGEVRYRPGTQELYSLRVQISGREWRSDNANAATVRRTENRVDLAAKQLDSTTGDNSRIVLTGVLPIRTEDRPEGC